MAGDEPMDINALIRNAARSAGRSTASAQERRAPVMATQRDRAARRGGRGDAAPLVPGDDDGAPCWVLQGNPVRDGMVLEVYTNKANGFVRGQVVCQPWPARPKLMVTLWNPWGGRDVDGLPPRVGQWELELPDEARCRFSAALPEEID
jgi:hypothetical protein